MKKLEKYKIALQAKFVKFKVKHFVEIPTIRHDKAVPPLLDCLKSSSPLNVSPPWLLKFSSCPLPGWWHKNHFPLIPGGEDSMKHKRLSLPWRHQVVSNSRPLDWQSSTLTSGTLLHKTLCVLTLMNSFNMSVTTQLP